MTVTEQIFQSACADLALEYIHEDTPSTRIRKPKWSNFMGVKINRFQAPLITAGARAHGTLMEVPFLMQHKILSRRGSPT